VLLSRGNIPFELESRPAVFPLFSCCFGFFVFFVGGKFIEQCSTPMVQGSVHVCVRVLIILHVTSIVYYNIVYFLRFGNASMHAALHVRPGGTGGYPFAIVT
jgi:hypothetical protein